MAWLVPCNTQASRSDLAAIRARVSYSVRSGRLGPSSFLAKAPNTRASCRPGPAARRRSGSRGSGSSPRAARAARPGSAVRPAPAPPDASSVWAPSAPPISTNFSLVLANSTAVFAAATGSGRPRERGRSLQHGFDAVESGPFQGEVGQPVLRDLEGHARRPHAAPQFRHLGDRQTRVLGDHDHRGVGEHLVQTGDELPLFGPVHVPSPNSPGRARDKGQTRLDRAVPGCPVRLSIAGTNPRT